MKEEKIVALSILTAFFGGIIGLVTVNENQLLLGFILGVLITLISIIMLSALCWAIITLLKGK